MAGGGLLVAGQYLLAPPVLSDQEPSILLVDTAGRVLTSLASSASAPGDGLANPTRAEGVTAFLQGWRDSTGLWERIRIVTPSGTNNTPQAALPVLSWATWFDNGASTYRRARGDANGAAAVTTQRPPVSSSESLTPDGADGLATKIIKAAAAQLTGVIASNNSGANAWIALVNKAGAVINGDTPRLGCLVANGATVVLGMDLWGTQGLHFSTGLSIGWSTTGGAVTLVGAGTGLGLTVVYT